MVTPNAISRSDYLRAGRWIVTFAGFPLGGLATELVIGPIDNPVRAALGGALTGAMLGAIQAWGLGPNRPSIARWVSATAAGLALGLLFGATAVGFATAAADLILQGAICGLAVGTLQALVLRPVVGPIALAWPAVSGAAWAIGWAVTSAVGVQVEEQFAVFGSTGALAATLLTAVLPVTVSQHARHAS